MTRNPKQRYSQFNNSTPTYDSRNYNIDNNNNIDDDDDNNNRNLQQQLQQELRRPRQH